MSNSAHLRLVGSPLAVLRFGRFEWQPQARELLVAGQPAALRGKALNVLAVLVEHAGQLVSRQTLMTLVWADVVVEENNLSVQINALRKVLGGDVIVTVPGRGYRFTQPVEAGCAAVPLRAVAPQARPGLAPQAALRSNLPEVPAPLVGREVELAALGAFVAEHRLVTVLGAAGIGKTRLAQAALHAARGAYTHGVCFVDLALLAPGDAIIATVAAALGLPQPSGADPMAGLLQVLAPLQMLLALDNAEHLLPAVATLVAVLSDGAPGVRIVVTSQAPLGVSDEWLFRLGPLALPPAGLATMTPQAAASFGAVTLFVLRAQACNARFAVTDANVAQLVALCTRLDGAPLAIELAAARTAHLGLATLLAGLDQRLAMLTGGRRDAPQRHQTLRAALDWSHALLSQVEQTVFRRFAVFVGSASLAEVLAVVADGDADADPQADVSPPAGDIDRWSALDALGTLIDRSLIEVLESVAGAEAGQGADRAPRYRQLETPRAFAREQLRAAGEEALMQQRHALALRAHYAQARQALFSTCVDFDAWRAELDFAIENGLAAATWAAQHDAQTALVLAAGLSRNIQGRRYSDGKALWQLVEPLIDAALAAPASSPPMPLAQAVCECSVFWTNHRPVHSRLRADQALVLARAAGDTVTQCLALAQIAWHCREPAHRAEFERVAATLNALRDPAWPAIVQILTSHHEWRMTYTVGDLDGALLALQHQAALHAACNFGDISPFSNMVTVLTDAGRLDEAIAMSLQVLARFTGSRHLGPSRGLLHNLICAYLACDDTVRARGALQDLWPLALSHDMLRYWAGSAALLAALEQRPQAALALLGFSDADMERAAPGRPRDADDQRVVDRADGLARAALGSRCSGPVVARFRAAGAALPAPAVLALALAQQDQAAALPG